MSTQSPQDTVIRTPQVEVIVCAVPGGGYTTCTSIYCTNVLHGHVSGDIRSPIVSTDCLVLYRLPCGTEVVGTIDDCDADGGILVEGFDSRETTPSCSGSSELFICRLPSGIGIVTTYDGCLMDGGTVIGKIAGRTR